MTQRIDTFLLVIATLLISTYLVFGLLFNYSKVWMHPELPGQFLPIVFENGRDLNLQDFTRIFDWQSICGGARSRVLSTLFLILDGKLRQRLWEILPPHPSLSVTWIFSLLSLFFLYQFLWRYFKNKTIAWRGLLLYMASVGWLSMFAMSFHPGKPLALFVLLLSLYLASHIFPQWGTGEGKSLAPYSLLLATLFVGFFVDETAWFSFLLIPTLYPEVLKRKELLFTFPLPFILALGLVTFVFPVISNALGYSGYPFWQYALSTNKSLGAFHYHRYFQNAYLFFRTQFFKTSYPSFDFVSNLVLFVYLFFSFRGLSDLQRPVFKRLLIAVGFCVFFQTLIMTKHLSLMKSPFYYGGLSSLMMSLCLPLVLSSQHGVWKLSHPICFLILLPTLLLNFEKTNSDWQKEHVGFYKVWFPQATDHREEVGTFTFSDSKRLWSHRHDRIAFKEKAKSIPITHLSIPWEIAQLGRQARVLSADEVQQILSHRKELRIGSTDLASIWKQPHFIGQYSEEIENLLAKSDPHCLRPGTVAYDIDRECNHGEKLKLMFLISSENVENTRKVRKMALMTDCCEPLL